MLRIDWQAMSITNAAFYWPHLLTLLTAGHVLSAHVHNLVKYVSKVVYCTGTFLLLLVLLSSLCMCLYMRMQMQRARGVCALVHCYFWKSVVLAVSVQFGSYTCVRSKSVISTVCSQRVAIHQYNQIYNNLKNPKHNINRQYNSSNTIIICTLCCIA